VVVVGAVVVVVVVGGVVVVVVGFGRVVVVVLGGRVVVVVLWGRVVVGLPVRVVDVVPAGVPSVVVVGSPSLVTVVELELVDDVEIDEVAGDPSAVVDVGGRSICVPRTSTRPSKLFEPTPPSMRSAPTQAATTHQNHRPSCTRCTGRTLPVPLRWRPCHALRPSDVPRTPPGP
jgi:hypothetical protein